MNNNKVDSNGWMPACGGTETPFRTRTGHTVLYMYNIITAKHAYYIKDEDIFIEYEQWEQYGLGCGNFASKK